VIVTDLPEPRTFRATVQRDSRDLIVSVIIEPIA
jgi:hypothetical protein